MMKLLIVGWYGAGNFGDEFLLSGLLALCASRQAHATVISFDVQYTQARHAVHAVDAADYSAIAECMRDADAMILGGGGLFQTHQSFTVKNLYSPLLGDIAYYARPVMLAQQFNVPVLMWAQGVGPLDSENAQIIVRDVARASHWISVRDQASLVQLRQCGYEGAVEVAPDPGWCIELPANSPLQLQLSKKKKILGIAIRSWMFDQQWEERFIQAIQTIILDSDWRIKWLSTQVNSIDDRSESDLAYVNKIVKASELEHMSEIQCVESTEQAVSVLATCDAVIAMRMHIQIVALRLALPLLCVEYDHKMAHVSEAVEMNPLRRIQLGDSQADWDRAVTDLLNGGVSAHDIRVTLTQSESRRHLTELDRVLAELEQRLPASTSKDFLRPMDWLGALEQDRVQSVASTFRDRLNTLHAKFNHVADQWVATKMHSVQAAHIAETANNQLRYELFVLRNSWSFKITRPLRLIRATFSSPKLTAKKLLLWIFWRLTDRQRSVAAKLYRKLKRSTTPSAKSTLAHVNRKRVEISQSEFLQKILHPDSSHLGVFILEPCIDWDIPLFQRPQHIANSLANLGYLVVYRVGAWGRDGVAGFTEITPRLWLCGEGGALEIDGAVHCFYSTSDAAAPENYVQARQSGVVIYEYVDHIDPKISGDAERIARLQEGYRAAFGGDVDFIVSTANQLNQEARGRALVDGRCLLIPNGVDTSHYFSSFKLSQPTSDEFLHFRQKFTQVVGYFGAMAPWLWYDVINEVASLLPSVGFVYIGPDYSGGLDLLVRGENILSTGPIHYIDLPAYGAAFDVCWIPFEPGEIAKTTSPLKLFEYFALQKPVVVTSEMHECTQYDVVFSGRDAPSLVSALKLAMEQTQNQTYLARLKQLAIENSWTDRAQQYAPVFAFAARKKRGAKHAERYRLSLSYAIACLDASDRSNATSSLDEPSADHRMHTTLRALHLLTSLPRMDQIALNTTRYLDIGSSYGGRLRVMLLAGVKQAYGLETDDQQSRWAALNTEDYANSLVCQINHLPATWPDFGTFDLITCTQRVFNVYRSELIAERVAAYLQKAGVCYFIFESNQFKNNHELDLLVQVLSKAKLTCNSVTTTADAASRAASNLRVSKLMAGHGTHSNEYQILEVCHASKI